MACSSLQVDVRAFVGSLIIERDGLKVSMTPNDAIPSQDSLGKCTSATASYVTCETPTRLDLITNWCMRREPRMARKPSHKTAVAASRNPHWSRVKNKNNTETSQAAGCGFIVCQKRKEKGSIESATGDPATEPGELSFLRKARRARSVVK